MSQTQSGSPVIAAKPVPNIYTALLVIAIVVVLIAIIVGLYTLLAASPSGYGLSFGDLFSKELPK